MRSWRESMSSAVLRIVSESLSPTMRDSATRTRFFTTSFARRLSNGAVLAAWRRSGYRAAIAERCAKPLGLDVIDVAHGIVEIANAAMTNALRLVSIRRGYDPRDFVLVAFGGAGPAHANRLAAENEIPTTLIPMSPGTASALGLLVTDLKHDFSAMGRGAGDDVLAEQVTLTGVKLSLTSGDTRVECDPIRLTCQ